MGTYELERRRVTEINAEASFRNSVNFGAIGDAYRTGGDLDSALKQAESYGRFAGLDIGVRYAHGAFASDGTLAPPLEETTGIYDHAAAPGVRAPHVWLHQAGQRISTLDLFNQGFCLLSGAKGAAWVDAADELNQKYDVPLAAFVVNGEGSTVTGEGWAQAYRIDETGAVLIRPDGHIGFRSKTQVENCTQVLEDALAVCLARVEL